MGDFLVLIERVQWSDGDSFLRVGPADNVLCSRLFCT